jgi:hypothetical protein
VTRKGSPVEGVAVTFIPSGGDGESAVGVTDSSGKFQLTTRSKDDGAVAGKYKVSLAKYEGQPATAGGGQMNPDLDDVNQYPEGYDESKASQLPPSKNVFPAKYSDADRSGLTADVQETDNTINFEIPD